MSVHKARIHKALDVVDLCLLLRHDMVDDLFSSDGISKEYLVILKQIEDYCSRGPEVDLDIPRSTNGNVSDVILNQVIISAETRDFIFMIK